MCIFGVEEEKSAKEGVKEDDEEKADVRRKSAPRRMLKSRRVLKECFSTWTGDDVTCRYVNTILKAMKIDY